MRARSRAADSSSPPSFRRPSRPTPPRSKRARERSAVCDRRERHRWRQRKNAYVEPRGGALPRARGRRADPAADLPRPNRIALQGDLLGAVALGIRNVLCLRGDDPTAGDQPEAKAVFDVGTTAVLADGAADANRAPAALGRSDRRGGAALPRRGRYAGRSAAGLAADGLVAKADAGADFFQTQFCMDPGVVRRYAARLLELGIAQRMPILIGVAPIPSARSARWMREKLVGTLIPEAIVARLERAAEPKREGRRICVELIRELAEIPGIAGAHVMAPRDHAAIAEVLADAGVNGKRRAGAG